MIDLGVKFVAVDVRIIWSMKPIIMPQKFMIRHENSLGALTPAFTQLLNNPLIILD